MMRWINTLLLVVAGTEVRGSDLYNKWKIQFPVVSMVESTKTIVVDYGINGELTSANIQRNIFTENCTGLDLTDYSYGILDDTLDAETGVHKIQIDPWLLAWDEDIFEANYDEQTAALKFCLRYSLWDDDSVEINYVYTLLTVQLNLGGQFGLTGLEFTTVEEVEETKAEQLEEGFKADPKPKTEARVDVFLCDPVTHVRTPPPLDGYGLGDVLSICVEATPNLIEEGLYLKGVRNFKWTRTYWEDGQWVTAEQYAVKDGVPDSLSTYYCPMGALFCTFTTMLIADFFSMPGYVVGEGGAEVGFLPVNSTDATRRNLIHEVETPLSLPSPMPNTKHLRINKGPSSRRSLEGDTSRLRLLIFLRGLDDRPPVAEVPVLQERTFVWPAAAAVLISALGLGVYLSWMRWQRQGSKSNSNNIRFIIRSSENLN